MQLRTCVLGLLPLTAAVAQDLLPSPIRAVSARQSATANCGLQPTRDGRGLLGGGASYRATFGDAGLRFEPALGRLAPATQHLTLRPIAVRRGAATIVEPRAVAPAQSDRTASYEHAPGLAERYEVRADGVELSWRFASRPAGEGDLVVRYAVDTSLPAPHEARGGLEFVHDGLGGVRIGDVTGVDAEGRTADGDVRWVDGGLELSLPAAFVANAVYPLVLDPVIGGVINVSSGLTYDDGEPDAAYDASTGHFLVVWQRTFSATNVDVRGQLVTHLGALSGGTIFFGSSGVASRPRVANLGTRDRFGVVWTQQVASTSTVEFEAVDASTGQLAFATTLATSTTSSFLAADIGAQTAAPIGTARGFVVVYQDDDLDAIRARRLWFNASDTLITASAISVFTDGLGSIYTQPAIARTAGDDGRLLVVARRADVFLSTVAIDSMVLDAGTNVLYTSSDIVATSTEDVRAPDVDGYGGRWVVAWERNVNGPNFYDQVRFAPVTYSNNTLTVGASSSFGGTLAVRTYAPTVGYATGRTWIGYQQVNSLPSPTTTLRVAAVDTASCTNCADTFSVPFPDGPRIVVATQLSGGDIDGEDCLCVYHDTFDDVYGQLLRNHGTSGAVTDLGGACGGPVSQTTLHPPGVGSSAMTHLLFMPSTTVAAIFNFTPPVAPVACGACAWLPFSVTAVLPGGFVSTQFQYSIPCLPALVGSQFETQWTTWDGLSAPCTLFPGFAVSNRLLLTIGQ